MKNIIIYFTGTGNSLAASRRLKTILGQTDIISVSGMFEQSNLLLDADTCGFVFPVYCQNIPEIIQRLVCQIQFQASTYVYAIATHNGNVGHSHFTLDKILQKRGQRLQAGFSILMPGNSITPANFTNSEEETNRRLMALAASIDEIADCVLQRKKLPLTGSNSLRMHLKGFRNMFRHKVLFKVPRKFWITNDCNHCGLCSRICPENNIRVVSTAVIWGQHCQMCLACIHWCPKHSIQNGEGTLNRKRYHHPDITINDMFCRS